MNSSINAVPRWKRLLFRLLAMLGGMVVGLILVEVILQWSPAVQLRIRGGRIALPLNQRTVFKNTTISKVDPEIVQTRNSLGFRGADPPSDLHQTLSIIIVGGSTTECYYLSDDKTWPEQLRKRLDDKFRNLWLNNAGLDGHSTFGHLRLFDQYLATLRPKCILFLIGANDIGLERSLDEDDRLKRDHNTSGVKKAYFWVVEHSATVALFDNFRRTFQAWMAGLIHQDINHIQLQMDEANSVEISPEAVADILHQHRERYLPGYRRRVERLVERCQRARILPVLITQPAMFGSAIDPETGVDLGRVTVGGVNGDVQWQILELYNSVTREVAGEENVPLIDLAKKLPKDSRLYYDYYHFTNAGAAEIAQLIAGELRDVLSRAFPEHARSVETRDH